MLDKLVDTAHRKPAAHGELIFHQDDVAPYFYLVVSGRVRLVQHTTDGKDVTMATFSSGDVIGLVVAVTAQNYPGSGEVLEDAEFLEMSGEPMWQIMNEYAPLAI